jgi:16S rRNA (uracil1498-N3)-methyltransferase
MRRYWVEASAINVDTARIEGEVFHHIFSVCRQEVGSVFELLPGNNTAVVVKVTSVGKKAAEAEVLEKRTIPPLPIPHIHLALSIPRFPVMDAVVEKAVEMGIHSIHPFFSEHSFVRKNTSVPEGKEERWRKIVVSATQQCGRGELMAIQAPQPLEKILSSFNRTKACMGLFAYEGDAQKNIREYLKSIPREALTEVWVFVGSEGGFSAEEAKQFQELGMEPVTLGEQVLRVETACITLSAVLKYEFELF